MSTPRRVRNSFSRGIHCAIDIFFFILAARRRTWRRHIAATADMNGSLGVIIITIFEVIYMAVRLSPGSPRGYAYRRLGTLSVFPAAPQCRLGRHHGSGGIAVSKQPKLKLHAPAVLLQVRDIRALPHEIPAISLAFRLQLQKYTSN
jgi:hypothetical protein